MMSMTWTNAHHYQRAAQGEGGEQGLRQEGSGPGVDLTFAAGQQQSLVSLSQPIIPAGMSVQHFLKKMERNAY